MNYLVVMVVEDIDYFPEVLSGWEAAGVLGVTILPSTGLGTLRRAGLRDDFPILPSMQDLFGREENQHRTLLSVVDSQEQVDKMVAVAEQVLGSLDDAHTGFLFVIPGIHAYGLGKHRTDRSNE